MDNDKKGIVNQLNSIIILLTSTVALGASIYGVINSNKNTQEISNVRRELSTEEKATLIQESFNINFPLAGMTVDSTNFPIYGIFKGNLNDLKDHSLWIFTYDKNGYNRTPKPVNVSANHKWFHDNVYYGLKGTFKVMVVLSGEEGTNWINDLDKKNVFAISKLHKDLQILDYIELHNN